MKRKIHPLTSTQVPITSTSRHELKDSKLTNLSGIEDEVLNLSNLKLKFLISQLAKKIKFLTPPLIKPENILENW